MPAILTVSGRGPETYGSDCPEHPEWSRHGLTRAHALNVVAKHNRESHASPVLNLSAAAQAVTALRHDGGESMALLKAWGSAMGEGNLLPALRVWQALTGLPAAEAVAYLHAVLAEPEDMLVHIAPF